MALVTCVHCGATVSAPDALAGKLARCGKCSGVITVPRGDGKFVHPPGLPLPSTAPPIRPVELPTITAIHHHNAGHGAFKLGFGIAMGCMAALAVTFGGCLVLGVLMRPVTQPTTVRDVYVQSAADAAEQYDIAKRNGSAIDAYTQAGLVAAAYLQAKDEANYQKWRQIQMREGYRAGLPAGMR